MAAEWLYDPAVPSSLFLQLDRQPTVSPAGRGMIPHKINALAHNLRNLSPVPF